MDTVKAVCVLDLFIDDIKGKFNFFFAFFDVRARQINPRPCLAIKFIFLKLHLEPGITKSPHFHDHHHQLE